jgi:glycosyltransferase involved in cell wall biosynthesis
MPTLRVCLASYQSVMMLKGGPRTQILQTKRCLEQLGVAVRLFESWEDFRKEDVDVLHLFGANIGTYHFAREIHNLGVPMVVSSIYYTRHSAPVVRSALAVGRTAGRLMRGTWSDYGLVAEICGWAQAVLPNTRKEAQLLTEGLGVPAGRVHVVPNGVEARFADADPGPFRKEYGLDKFVLNVGHIGPQRKNVLRLIQALEKINAPAVIIGRIEENDYGRRCLAESKKNPRLLVLDSLPNDSPMLASAYAACEVFALPSQFETPGIAALEAGLAGAKIAITRHGGTEEYFGPMAEYVEPTSWELIHHGITTALNRTGDGALREHIRENFLWERVAEKTLEVYRTVV